MSLGNKLAQGSAPVSIHPAPPVSSGRGWKPLWMLVGGLVALLFLTFISLTQGLADISVNTVVQALVSPQDIADHHLIRGVRLPRTVMGLLAGAALAVSGVLMQTVTRNPLASGTTLGVNAGAYLAVVAGMIFWPGLFASVCPSTGSGRRNAGGCRRLCAGGKNAGLSSADCIIRDDCYPGFILRYECAGVAEPANDAGDFLWGSGSLIQNDWDGVAFHGRGSLAG